MCSILLSIKPDYVEKIFSGDKKYEFRTRISKEPIDKIYIYATTPVKKVVGEAVVEATISASPTAIWEQTKSAAGITRRFFRKYFHGKKHAYAYKLGKVIEYKQPLDLQTLGLSQAPQSFVYLNGVNIEAQC
jgi:predicted transcriptional regulator